MNRKGNPLYRQVRDQLLQQLLEMNIRAGDRLPPETALAQALSVSRSTVKRALSELVEEQLVEQRVGSGTYALPKLVEFCRTMRAAEKAKRIALVVPEISDRYSYRILRGVCRQIEENNDDLELYNTSGSAEKENRILERLLSTDVDGVILWPAASYGSSALLQQMVDENYPLVLIDHTLAGLNCHCIMSDHVDSGYQATRYLLERGHRNIGFIDTSVNMALSQLERFQGYRKALEGWGLSAPHALGDILFPPGHTEEFKAAIRQYFEDNPQLTAAICGGGVVMRVIRMLNMIGREVPRDISLVCFDGFENSRYVATPPTYIRQAEDEIGREAVRLLHRLFRTPELERRVVQFPATLYEGETVRTLEE